MTAWCNLFVLILCTSLLCFIFWIDTKPTYSSLPRFPAWLDNWNLLFLCYLWCQAALKILLPSKEIPSVHKRPKYGLKPVALKIGVGHRRPFPMPLYVICAKPQQRAPGLLYPASLQRELEITQIIEETNLLSRLPNPTHPPPRLGMHKKLHLCLFVWAF